MKVINVAGTTFEVTIDTRANILALAPTEPTIAISTDEPAFYVYNGTAWQRSPIIFGTPSTGVDMGALPFNDDKGYGEFDLSRKKFHSVILGYFNEELVALEGGALRFNATTQRPEVYDFSVPEWKQLIPLTEAEFEDRILWSDDWDGYDAFGKNIIHGHKVDMGAFASDHIIDGGVIGDQLL